jgi:pimeloyl-ACP methyl ester carboxylesterase
MEETGAVAPEAIEPSFDGTVTSSDGTTIGYSCVGQGNGLVLVHGAGQTAESFRTLATELASRFTVFVPDRRGRGRSPSYGDFQGLRTEVADLEALLDATGARYVFGLSSGAVVAIETALVRPDVAKLALYEPPLNHDRIRHDAWAPRYERELAAGRPGSALVACLKGTSDRTAFRLVPGFLLAKVLDLAVRRTAARPVPPGTFSPSELIPTIHYDVQTVTGAAGPLDRFAALSCQVLLLGGSKSARNLMATLDDLHRVLPGAGRITIHGVGHTAADNAKQPDRVAAELLRFFG